MDNSTITSLLEQLDDNLDDLEEALHPLLQHGLVATADKLPLLDKAHLYVFFTYTIESILFSYLRLNNVNAKEHPVFRELTRVKQYFEKLKLAESVGTAPTTKLDKAAAARFIKHALAGNPPHAASQPQQESIEKSASHIRFAETDQKVKNDNAGHVGLGSELSGIASKPDSLDGLHQADSTILEEKSFSEDDRVQSKAETGQKRKSRNESSGATLNSIELEGLSKQERKRRKMRKNKESREVVQAPPRR